MDKKYYEPALVWAIATKGIEARGNTIIKIYLKETKTGSHFQLRKNRVYWKQDPNQSYIVRVDNNILAENSENLGEVIGENWFHKGDAIYLGKTYAAFIDYITTYNPF